MFIYKNLLNSDFKKVAVLISAGGLSSRFMGMHKFQCPVSSIKGRCTIEIIIDKIKAAEKKFNCSIPIIIIASKQTEKAIKKIAGNNVNIILQKEIPIKRNGVEDKTTLMPNGNGDSIYLLKNIWDDLKNDGIEGVFFMTSDNPLLDPIDEKFIYAMNHYDADVVLRCIKKKEDEKVGVIKNKDGKVYIEEYIYGGDDVYANISNFLFSKSFIDRVINVQLPYNLVEKEINDGEKIEKKERFIFDLLHHSNKSVCVIDNRNECFSPLKSIDDLNKVKKMILKREKLILKKIAGINVNGNFELNAQFYYPNTDLYSDPNSFIIK